MSSLLHVTSVSNTLGPRTTLDHPLLNLNDRAVVIVTSITTATARSPTSSFIALEYGGGRWSILCLDGAAMPIGAAFCVLIYPEPYRDEAWIHRSTHQNTIANATWIERAGADGDPTTVLLVTPRITVGGVTTRYPDISPFPSPGPLATDYGGAGWIKTLQPDPVSVSALSHPIGVWYNEGTGRWNIFYQDWQPIPSRAEFNVVRLDRNTYGSFSEHVRVVVSPGATDHVDTSPEPPQFEGFFFYVTPNMSFWLAERAIVEGDADSRSIPCDFPFSVRRNPVTGRPSIYPVRGGVIPPGVGFNVRHDSGRGL